MLLAIDDLGCAFFGLKLAKQAIVEIESKRLARAGHSSTRTRPIDVRVQPKNLHILRLHDRQSWPLAVAELMKSDRAEALLRASEK